MGISEKGFQKLAAIYGKKAQEEEERMLSVYDDYALDPDLIEILFQWHGGGGSAVYQLASNIHGGHDVPVSVAEEAINELEISFSQLEEGSEEHDELANLLDMLNYWVNPY